MWRSASRWLSTASAERRRQAWHAVLGLCAGSILLAEPASAQLLVDPLQVVIVSPHPGRFVSSVSVSNTSDQPVQTSISRGDWDRAENGDNRFFPSGSTPHSCGAKLAVSPASLRLEPHSSRVVRLSVTADSALTSECWDIVFIEEIPQHTTSVKKSSLEFTFRTGVKVYLLPPDLRQSAAVENMVVVDSPKRAIAIQFHNTGAIHLFAKGRLEFRRLDNSVLKQVEIKEFPTLPGATRRVVIEVPGDLAPGDYIALAMIDFGGAELVAGQIDFEAK
ncbi:MAG TPA: fimbria/pilus periplasmic chaperone [Gemmatimonadaceae bacterium]